MAKSICLNMIVRNEAHCIERCLASVRPLISYWVICDTGSHDGTQELVGRLLQGIPGELHSDPWEDFSHNRNLGLRRSRGKAEYHLFLDADFAVRVAIPFDTAELTADGYLISFEGDVDWRVVRLVSDRHDWQFRGRVHETLFSATAKSFETLRGLTIEHHADGSNRVDNRRRYLELLLGDFRQRPADPRTVFYLGQAFADLGQYDEAVAWYGKRLQMGGWEEELWYSAYRMTWCKEKQGKPWPEVLQSYLECYEMRPWRWEPLQRICEYHRDIKHYELNYLLARRALDGSYPSEDIIFIERPVYLYGLLMELALASFWTQRFEEAEQLLNRVLGVPHLPENYRQSALKLLAELAIA